MEPLPALPRYDSARRALAEAKAVDEVKMLRDKAIALKVYAKQAQDKTLEEDAAEIRLRAERRLREMMAEQKATVGTNQGGWTEREAKSRGLSENPQDRPPTLAEAGIDKNLAHRAQRRGAVSRRVRR